MYGILITCRILAEKIATFVLMDSQELYMQRCLDLAIKGAGRTLSNPLVGSVIVHEGKIIGEGYHEFYGGPHAEVNAIRLVKNPELLAKSTLYVNLEPCSHFGKTPPCSDLILASKIPRVVIGALDSHSQVNGQGIKKLRANGVNVTVDVLRNECRELNRRFYTFHEKKRPYIVLKWARDPLGYMDIDRELHSKGIHWITQPETQQLVHKWRSEEMAILVGRKTIENDNPSLTVRAIKGPQPIRVVLDPGNKLSLDFQVFDASAPTLRILKSSSQTSEKNTLALFDFSIENVLDALRERNIDSVFVEGGATTLNHFIEKGLWDEARIVSGQNAISKGQKAPAITGKNKSQYSYGKDLVTILRNPLHIL